jgi:uncharacterized membrane protein YesL
MANVPIRTGMYRVKIIANGYVFIGNWGLRLFLLNVMWFLSSLIGLVIFGISPATAALFGVIRKLMMASDPDDIKLFKEFWTIYKREFFKSNILGYIFFVVGFVLFLDLRVLFQLKGSFLHLFLICSTLIIALVYIIALFNLFPLLVHFNLKTFDYIKYALILTIASPLQSLILILAMAILIFLLIKLPGFIPVMGVSLICFLIMKIVFKSLPNEGNLANS